jgi:segregation and condensation protein B
MDEREMMAIVESILFVSGDPVSLRDIADTIELDVRKARKLMERMIDCFNFERRGLQIVTINDTYQLVTRPEFKEYIEKFIGAEQGQTLSQALLETLAIIAYKQPVTKSDIDTLRGVKCDYSIMNLVNRGLVKEVARMDAPGRPILYGTTDLFLRTFGFSSIEDLPKLEHPSE